MLTDRLPAEFLEEMQDLLKEDYPEYLRSIGEVPLSGLRVNTLKAAPETVAARFGLTERVPWTPNGYYLPADGGYTRDPWYFAGLYYMQEPSAMSSAALLGTQAGERVLDLCAAPGGKTTQIGADLKGQGLLVANDLSASRAKALLKNIELMGIGNALVTCEDSDRLVREFPLFFDRILVDAPCSGEGMFRKHPAVIRAWLEHGKDFYCGVQQKLLCDAAEMLKPGGTLLYSTCTYNRHEDEDQIAEFLASHPDFTLDPVTGIDGFTDSALLPGCVRLFPHKAKAEGHFVARLKKSADAAAGTPRAAVPARRKKTETLPGDMDEFLKKTSFRPDPDRIVVENEYVSLLPEIPSLPKLRYLRTGLLLGQLKNGRFRPSQALAMFLTKEQWQDPVDLSRDDPDVIRYLKGETVNADREDTKGFRLLCVDGYPLGFVKQDRSRLKNMYLPGWRMQ